MAAARPIVLVYQDFASVSTPIAYPQLNLLLVGPAYFIQDYLTDYANLKVTTIGSLGTTPTGVASAGTTLGATNIVTAASAMPAGAIVDNASCKMWLDGGNPTITSPTPALNAYAWAEVAYGNVGSVTAGQATFTSAAGFTNALDGDRLVVKIATSPSTIVFATTVTRINTGTVANPTWDTTNIMMADCIPATNSAVKDWTGQTYNTFTTLAPSMSWRLERKVVALNPTAGSTVVWGPNVGASLPVNQVKSSAAIAVSFGGTLTNCPVTYANVYVEYRALRTDLSATLNVVTDDATIKSTIGRIDERNPLAAAARVAIANSQKAIFVYGTTGDGINFTTTAAALADVQAAHATAITNVNGRRDIYCIVPLTNDLTTINAWKANCVALADPSISKFRIVIGSGSLPTTAQVFPATGTATCNIENVTTNWYIYDTSGQFLNGVNQLYGGVTAGDYVYFGANSYVVTAVSSNNRLTVTQGTPALTVQTGQAYSVQRTLNKTQQVTSLSAATQSLASNRCTMVWPDQCTVASVSNARAQTQSNQPGFYLAAALGGMVSGLPPHQGFTNIGIAGITRVFDSNDMFSDPQIDALGSAGWFVFVQDDPNAIPYSVHELTTDTSTLESGELMVVKNFDYVSTTFRNSLLNFLGKYNVLPETTGLVRSTLEAVAAQLKSQVQGRIGSPLLDMSITSVAPLTGSKDRLEAYISVSIPRVLNRIGLHLTA